MTRTYSTRGALRDPQVRNHFIYRLYDAAGVLMYVGCSIRPLKRIKEHSDSGRAEMVTRISRIRVTGPYTYQKARQLEYDAIRTENPTESAQTPAAVAARRERHRAFDAAMRRHMDLGLDIYRAMEAAWIELYGEVAA